MQQHVRVTDAFNAWVPEPCRGSIQGLLKKQILSFRNFRFQSEASLALRRPCSSRDAHVPEAGESEGEHWLDPCCMQIRLLRFGTVPVEHIIKQTQMQTQTK